MAAAAATTAVLRPRAAAVETKTPAGTAMVGKQTDNNQQSTKSSSSNGDRNGDDDSDNDDEVNEGDGGSGRVRLEQSEPQARRRWGITS
jgi:hypothetical protein